MNKILKENLSYFEIKEQELINYRTNNNEDKILCMEAKEGTKGLCIKKEDKMLYVHSKYYPKKEACRWTKSVKEGVYNYIIFGLGLGYHIEESINKLHKEGNILLIIPEKEFLYDLLQLKSFKKIFKNHNVYIHILKDKLYLKNFLYEYIQWERMNSIEFFHIPVYDKIYEKELHITSEALRECILNNVMNENTRIVFSEKWQKNIFDNMPFIFESIPITVLKESFSNIPAIIVSAGPSLNKNVHLLKDIKDKALILCVDTALGVLQKEDIKPDLVISIDGSDLNYEKFRGVQYEEIPLVYTSTSNHKIISQHRGKKIVFLLENYIRELFIEKGYDPYLRVGGSVATVAFQMAKYVEANPIIFIGQDLAFTDGEDHAKGTMYDRIEGPFKRKKKVFVKGNIEDKVYTDYSFKTYLDWFQDSIISDKTDRIYINATEGGAYIEGTKIMTLQEVIDKYCINNNNIKVKLEDILSLNGIFSKEEIIDIYKMHKESVKTLKKVQCKAKKAVDLVKQAINLYEGGKADTNKTSKIFKELDSIDKFIKEKKNDTSLISYIIQKSITEMEYIIYRNEKAKETDKEKALRVMNGNLILYRGIYESIEETIEIMEEYLKKMNEKYNI